MGVGVALDQKVDLEMGYGHVLSWEMGCTVSEEGLGK